MNIDDWSEQDKIKLGNYLQWNSYRSEQHKLLYVATPKVACTTLKWWIASLEGLSEKIRNTSDSFESDPELVIHDVFHRIAPNVTGLKLNDLSDALTQDEFFRFALVRNPYKRIFSAWQSKILLREPLQSSPYISSDFYHYPIKNMSDIAGAFESFLEHIAANETPTFLDLHWTPQVNLLRPDIINYSSLVKIEEVEKINQSLSDWLGPYIPTPFRDHRSNESMIPYLSEFVTERSKQLICALYGLDFETFGYETKLPESKAIFSTEQWAVAYQAIKLIRGRHQRISDFNEFKIKMLQIDSENKSLINSFRQSMNERDVQNNILSQQLKDFERQIHEINEVAVVNENKNHNLAEEINKRDIEINMLNENLRECARQINIFNQISIDNENKVSGLVQSIEERDIKITSLHQEIEEREIKIHSLNELISDYESKLEFFNQAIYERNSKIDSLNKAVADSEFVVSEIIKSTSWKLTRPMRLIGSKIKHTKRKLSFNYNCSENNSSSNIVFNNADKDIFDSINNQEEHNTLQQHSIIENSLSEFDPEFYLKAYPDIANAGIDPKQHYLLHGRLEGRIPCMPEVSHFGSVSTDFDPSRENVLVVSHEASRTGAPILSLNLVRILKKQYNVLVLILGGGPLISSIRELGAVVIEQGDMRYNNAIANIVIEDIVNKCDFKFALVNSIESRVVLPILAKRFIPSITLLHEFAAYTRPYNAFRDAFLWSGEAVFSARLTLQSALDQHPELGERFAHVLPQGRCILPNEVVDETIKTLEKSRLISALWPNPLNDKPFIVLGAGYVQLRKGVDLFIECASRLFRMGSPRNIHFVWVGKGYDPKNDVNYSVYLADQIERAGLSKNITFLDETSEIDFVYKESDLLLLTSRLDPLPNVAIDALNEGLPVLCFDKATGIADILTEGNLKEDCVAEYIDTQMLADKVYKLANDSMHYDNVSKKCKNLAGSIFDMEDYVKNLQNLAETVTVQVEQERQDVRDILDSKLLDINFCALPTELNRSLTEIVREYVRSWATGIGRRKPFAGFNPEVYRDFHGGSLLKSDPLAHYIRSGCPQGPWLYPVIRNTDLPLPVANSVRIALHLHVYYPDLLPLIIERLQNNIVRPDLFVSVPSEKCLEEVSRQLAGYNGKVISIEIVPNRGRDIGPFFSCFGSRIKSNYDFVGHLHTKKTADVEDSSMGANWYEFLLDNLLGGESGAMMDRILGFMSNTPTVGMVFPDDPNVVGWCENKPYATVLAKRLGIKEIPDSITFPVGTMFWARVDALINFLNMELSWDDYPEEPLPYDGSILHAMERLLPLGLANGVNQCALTNVCGVSR